MSPVPRSQYRQPSQSRSKPLNLHQPVALSPRPLHLCWTATHSPRHLCLDWSATLSLIIPNLHWLASLSPRLLHLRWLAVLTLRLLNLQWQVPLFINVAKKGNMWQHHRLGRCSWGMHTIIVMTTMQKLLSFLSQTTDFPKEGNTHKNLGPSTAAPS